MARNHEGVYIALEGGDGSGKGTQTKELVHDLQERGFNVLATDYPQYGMPSARYVERYLNGEYGAANDVHPDLAALTYMIDRLDYETLHSVHQHLMSPLAVVVSNRSVASNMAHQGTKIAKLEDRLRFYREILEMEYGVLRDPRPDLNLVLRVPAHIAQANVDKKDAATRKYTTAKRDIHEADANHLNLALRGYNEVIDFLPEEFIGVDVIDTSGNMRPIDKVHQEIMELIWLRNLLPHRHPAQH